MEKVLKEWGLWVWMFLQIYDELVFEVLEEEIVILEELVFFIMDLVVKLDVLLKVESKFGVIWYDLKK